MQAQHNGIPRYSQAEYDPNVETIHIGDVAEEVHDPQEEFRQFRGRYLNRHAATQLKWAIVTLWQKDEMDPVEAVNWLYECGFVKFHEADGKDADAFMQFYSIRERNKAEGRAA